MQHRPIIRLQQLLLLCSLSLVPGIVLAAAYSLPADIGSGPFSSCSGTGPSYSCSGNIRLNNNDTVTLTADVTLNISGDFETRRDVIVDANGFIFDIVASGDIKLGDRSQVEANLDAAGKIELGKNGAVNGNLSAGSELKVGDDATISGNLFSGGKIDIGKRFVLAGDITAVDDIKIDEAANITGDIASSGKIEVKKLSTITGDLNAGDDIKLDRDIVVNGDITTSGNLDIGAASVVNGACTPNHPQCTGGAPPGSPDCDTFYDAFAVAAYSNQNGSLNWAGNWNEVGDNGNPGGGAIRINTGALEFRGGNSAANALGGPYIEREADLTGYTSATLSFDYYESGAWENTDDFEIYVSGDGGSSWTLLRTFTDDQGSTPQPFSADITAYIAANTRIAFVEKMDSNGERFHIDNVQIEVCLNPLDHFRITPAATNASTCLPNAITIVAEDAANAPVTDYTGTVDITTSTGHGNWSVNAASNPTVPNPDVDDDGAVTYTFAAADAGTIVLDLSNTRAETLTISVSDPLAAVTSTSVAITFADNVFVITEDAVQVAGRPQSMRVAMWTNDGANCFIDTSYDYNPQALDVSIDRAGVLPGAIDPQIGGTPIPDGPASAAIPFDFSATPGQAVFSLDTSDVGQYRLTIIDNSNVHAAVPIVGSSALLTVRPFGLAVTGIQAGGTPNPGATVFDGDVFTAAGADFTATVSGVLWDAADDADNNGVLDIGGRYENNTVAPSYAWDTRLSPSGMGFTPATGTVGTLSNGAVTPADIGAAQFGGGSATLNTLRYDEVGSFTLQASATGFLGVAGVDISGDDTVVGRFRPASFEIAASTNGAFQDTCTLFTYVGEDFFYFTAPSFEVRALNAQNLPTGNYRDAFARLGGGDFTVAVTQGASVPGSIQPSLDVSLQPMTVLPRNDNSGLVDVTFGADSYRYGTLVPGVSVKDPGSLVAPFPADINLEITQIDEIDLPPVAVSETLDPTPNNLRFGRLRMINTHGSELISLRMPVIIETWNGFGFQINGDDSCSTVQYTSPGQDLSLDDSNLSVPGSSTPSVPVPIANGQGEYQFSAPGAGVEGYIDVTTVLDASGADLLWLRFDWDGDGDYDDDPTARASFGIYDGNPVQIFIQQTYQ